MCSAILASVGDLCFQAAWNQHFIAGQKTPFLVLVGKLFLILEPFIMSPLFFQKMVLNHLYHFCMPFQHATQRQGGDEHGHCGPWAKWKPGLVWLGLAGLGMNMVQSGDPNKRLRNHETTAPKKCFFQAIRVKFQICNCVGSPFGHL